MVSCLPIKGKKQDVRSSQRIHLEQPRESQRRGLEKEYIYHQSFQHQDRDYHYERKENNASKRQHRNFSASPQMSNLSTGSDFDEARSKVGKDNQGNHLKGFYFRG